MQSIEARPTPVPRNGVDTPALFATIGAVKGQPELARFQFRASSRWLIGTHSVSRVEPFSGAGGTHNHEVDFQFHADHPKVLTGGGAGPTPVEYLLHGLAACLIAGVANVAAARGVTLSEVAASLEGDIDLRGILGLSRDVRNGYQGIRVGFRIKGDATEAELQQIVEQSRARSAVFDVLTNGTRVDVDVDVA